jgi:hypothetical protein
VENGAARTWLLCRLACEGGFTSRAPDYDDQLVAKSVEEFGEAPRRPGIYVFFGGTGIHEHAAYVGSAKNLRLRLEQHFFRRNSSVVTGASATGLNVDHVRRVAWWRNGEFDDKVRREAAELVAFEFFSPSLRSRGTTSGPARKLAADDDFVAEVRAIFESGPSDELVMPRLIDVDRRLTDLELKFEELTQELQRLRGGS